MRIENDNSYIVSKLSEHIGSGIEMMLLNSPGGSIIKIGGRFALGFSEIIRFLGKTVSLAGAVERCHMLLCQWRI